MKIGDIGVKKSCSLHACLRHVMRFARCCGFFPVQGLNQTTADGTKYKIKCFYGIYNTGTIIGQVAMLSFSVLFSFDINVVSIALSYASYNAMNLLAAIFLARLAKHWPKLLKMAEETEQSMTFLEWNNHTIKKANIIASMMIALALVEHILWINFVMKLIIECLNETRFNEILETYVELRLPYIVDYIPYSVFSASLALIVNFQATLLWSVTDILTICCSIYITSCFYNLDKSIHFKRSNGTILWGQIREQYSKLALLVKQIDDELSCFILLTFSTDLYFICLQLFFILRKSQMYFDECENETFKRMLASPDYFLYYYSSFLFTAIRALCRSLFIANVHIAAQKPIIPVYEVQSAEYDNEVLRFQLILRYTTVALSGKFFYVTRNTILKAIATIVTYELVLLQFTATNVEDNLVHNTIATNETFKRV